MKRKKEAAIIITLICICCAVMAVVDGVIQPDYAVKSGVKLVLFLLCPISLAYYIKDIKLRELFRRKKETIKISLILGVALYAAILIAYFGVRGIFDFSGVTESLTNNIGVTGKRFIWVALYISFINSLLEEFFFRGFAFISLMKFTSRKFAYLFSSLLFALYHVAMMIGWFPIPLLLLIIVGLMVGGMLFDYLNEKSKTIYSSWMVHMFANLGINTVGFILFGMTNVVK